MGVREENHRQFLQDMAEKNYKMQAKPLELMAGLTNVCNLQCVFCPYCGICTKKVEKKEELSNQALEKFSVLFPTGEFLNPSLCGEPFLYPHLDEFFQHCRNGDILCNTQLINNATQLEKYDLKKLRGVNVISISFDGADQRTFESLRVGANFEKILANMEKLRIELPDTVLQITVVVCRLNLCQLADIYSIAQEKGFNYITFNTIYGPENDRTIQLLRLRESDRAVLDAQIEEIRRRNADEKMHVQDVTTFDGFEDGAPLDREMIFAQLDALRGTEAYLDFDEDRDISQPDRRVHTECRSDLPAKPRLPYCTGPWNLFIVMPDEKVLPCCASFGSIGRLSDGDIVADVWNSQNYQDLRRAMFDWDMLPDYCKACKVFMRYDYLNDYVDYLKAQGVSDKDIEIPPNFYPNRNLIRDDVLWDRICKKQREDEWMNFGAMNSAEYWEGRFSANDWANYDGGGQSAFFSKVALASFPDWFSHALKRSEWMVSDWGCAEGDGTAVLAKEFPSCRFTGVDFSTSAIEKARQQFPLCNFCTGDLTADIQETDVIFSSNTLEHFTTSTAILRKLVAAARQHAVILLPLHDELELQEHFCRFDEEFFPLELEGHALSYFRIIDCDGASFWPGEQILLIYSAPQALPADRRLSELFSNEEYLRLKKTLEDARAEITSSKTQVAAAQQSADGLQAQLAQEASHAAELQVQLAQEASRAAELQAQLAQEANHAAELQAQLAQEANHAAELQAQLAQETQQASRAAELQAQLAQEASRAAELRAQLAQEASRAAELRAQLAQEASRAPALQKQLDCSEYKIDCALQQLNAMTGSGLFKLVHFLNRLKCQGFGSDGTERKKFRRWLRSRLHHVPDHDHRYNPLFAVIHLLTASDTQSPVAKELLAAEPAAPIFSPSADRLNLLLQPYTKPDVIVLSIIDYSFRHQRPQHFAQRLAQKGHRVYYVNANFTSAYDQSLLEEKLWQVTLENTRDAAIYSTDWDKQSEALQAQLDRMLGENVIRDAVVIVDYPNWIHGALYLREKYGLRLVTDYMDDFTGFLNPAEALVRKNCERLLQESDSVMASSQFLYDIAAKYARHVAMNRNGTEFDYFHQAWQALPVSKSRPVIGYYGAIAEWFNADIVCRCAQRFPACDIVLVGNITDHRKELEQYDNIRLIGEVPYAKLLPWLASFDVCLIPFDASTDLIKATNPVKFYEYLSAGKKIVATEIPELEPYRDRLAYLENDAEAFCDAVEQCLNGTDTLAGEEECFAFAKENDWDARAAVFEQEALAVYPKISVIVLCYNQLDYTKKCVESVLNVTAYPNYELILVDNASSDATADYLQTLPQKYDNVKLVLNETNRGFAGGNNDGIAVADGEYLVLLNNDTVVARGWLTGLLKHFRNDETVGLVGPVTNSIGNEAQINTLYQSIEEMPAFADDYTFRHMGEEFPHHGVLAMFCLMISRELYERAGPLDEGYGIGMFEDDDYSTASKKLGYRNVLAEDVFIHHYGSVSFKKLEDASYMTLFEKNRTYFERKWNTKWSQHQYRSGVQ